MVRAEVFEPGSSAKGARCSSISASSADIGQVLPAGAVVKVGIEAAGHYHRPSLMAGAWPIGWEPLELNPGHVWLTAHARRGLRHRGR